ncbi:MAG: tape measure protein [Lachnospiraceae bacterium]|nr:tape measure protein [Lachnospiraceae bacterium]
MAGISTSIRVQDGVSRAMGTMAASINVVLTSFAELQSATGQAVNMSAINSAQVAMHEMEESAAALDAALTDAAAGQGRHNSQIRAGTNAMDGLLGKVKAMAGAYLSIQAVKGIFSQSDELASTTARLNLMNDGQQTTQELFELVAASSDNARSSISDMASVVARFGNNAKDAFSSSAEVVDFANLVSKSMTIAGASTQESAASMLQLSQALGSGALRGDELNSIFEQAPNLIGYIAQYMDVPIGKIREMASEGELTADIVKAAIFAASDDINGKFEQMPTTWGQIVTGMGNAATVAFQPALQQLSDFASSEDMQVIIEGAKGALADLGEVASEVVGIMVDGAGFIVEYWDVIEPAIVAVTVALGAYLVALGVYTAVMGIHALVTGTAGVAEFFHSVAMARASQTTFAATVAQYGFNAALLACPLTWIIIAIIAVIAIIYMAVAAVNHATGSTYSAMGIICGAIAVAGAFIGNIVLGLINFVIGIGIQLWNLISNFVNAFSIIFNNPVAAIETLFLSLFNFIVGIVEAAAGMIDTILGTNLSGAVEGFRAKVQAKIDTIVTENGGNASGALNPNDYKLKPISYGDAWDAGYNFGANLGSGGGGLEDIMKNAYTPPPSSAAANASNNAGKTANNTGATAGNTGQTADNTAAIANAVDVSNEQLKYLRDIAERDTVNRFTTASIKVTMNNNNNVNSGLDLDGIVNDLAYGVENAMAMAAEGVHK